MPATSKKVSIVGVGGTFSGKSSTDRSLALALASAERFGAETHMFGGDVLAALPIYGTAAELPSQAALMLDAIRKASGLIIASPGYHGTVSGLVKNALDYLEETSKDRRVYLDGLPVGLIATAFGGQATGSTLAALRSIVHALRGWPTPFGAAIVTSPDMFEDAGRARPDVAFGLDLVGEQVVTFAQMACARGASAQVLATTQS
jgi:FMN reductase